MNSENIQNILKEKNKLKGELDRALSDIDQLKTLLAQNTNKTVHTNMDEEEDDPYNGVKRGGINVNKTFD